MTRPPDYPRLAELFDEVAVSDIAWRRTLPWRVQLAGDWPEVGRLQRARRSGARRPTSLLLAGWLRARLGREVQAAGRARGGDRVGVRRRPGDAERRRRSHSNSSELLSAELETFSRDRVYEAAVRAT